MSSTNFFQQTLDIQCQPIQALQGDDREAFDRIVSIADLNFTTIENFIDGTVDSDPFFYTDDQNTAVRVSRLLAMLHNYLATIYSYNENLVKVLPEYLSSRVSNPGTTDFAGISAPDRSLYTKQFNFILGLRTDAQHGTFSGFTITNELWDESRRKHHVKFDRDGFVNSTRLENMSQYLSHTNSREREYIISFLASFHRSTLQRFHDDLLDWFDQYES